MKFKGIVDLTFQEYMNYVCRLEVITCWQCNSIKDKGKQSIKYSGLRFYNNEMESYVDIFLILKQCSLCEWLRKNDIATCG